MDGGPWCHESQCCWIVRDRKRREQRRLRWRGIRNAKAKAVKVSLAPNGRGNAWLIRKMSTKSFIAKWTKVIP